MDVLLIARQDDEVAHELCGLLKKRGKVALILDGVSAARLFTVRSHGAVVTVSPQVPLFLRPSAWWTDTVVVDDDERFLRTESYSTLWAAAALSAAPVLNRPSERGLNGLMTGVAGNDEHNLDCGGSRPEIFASRSGELCEPDGLWGEDLGTYRRGPVRTLDPNSPIRARNVDATALYEVIAVVGERGFASTDDPRTNTLALVQRSVAIAKGIGLMFATITWAIGQSGDAMLARINHGPTSAELQYSWSEVGEALCEELSV